MKKMLVVFSLLFLIAITSVDAASNPYPKTHSLYGPTVVNCTWYAWQQAYDNAGVALPGWGNAQSWYSSAKKAGYSVGREAKANSIMVLSSDDGYGHVGYVVSVSGDAMYVNEAGVLTTNEIHCEDNPNLICSSERVALNGDGIGNNIYRSTVLDNLIGFIYLDEVPTKVTSSSGGTSSSSSASNSSSSGSKKSNNNYLSSLTIDGVDFVFDKDTLEYVLEVDYQTKIINIDGVSEEESAVVNGLGQKALVVGVNEFVVSVTAENGEVKEYYLTITRREKAAVVSETVDDTLDIEKQDTTNENIFWIIGIVSGVVVIILIGVVILVKKRKTFKKEK